MTELSISLLGTYALQLNGEPVTGLAYDKVQALLTYLLLEPGHPHPREHLAGLLWPESTDSGARSSLRTALYRLRTLIHDHDADPPLLLITHDTLQLHPDAPIRSDVGAFLERFATAQNHTHPDPVRCTQCAETLAEAVTLYRGDLLATFSLDSAEFETWLVTRREALHRQALDALGRLAAAQLARGEHELALDYARRGIELEPWRESAHRQAMQALALSGQRAAAIAQYEACRTTLQTELGIEPEGATAELHARIRRGELAPALASPSATRAPPFPVAAATDAATPAGTGHTEILAAIPDSPAATPVAASANGDTSPTSERRTTTLVSATVTGTEALLASAGLEVWAETLGRVLDQLRTEVERYGGTILRTRTAGLIAVFGAAVAHEDDAERAILAALAMQGVVTGDLGCTGELPCPAPLGLSVGVTTDEAIVLAQAAGTPTVHAAALSQMDLVQAQVSPGTLWVTEATYRHVESRFTWAWLGEALGATPSAAGVTRAAIRLYRPVAPIPDLPAEHNVGGLRAPLVGRDAELKALTDAVAAVSTGIGGIVTIVGEPGIGKSRLVAEARALATSPELVFTASDLPSTTPDLELPTSDLLPRWVEGHWLSYTEGMAYHGWQELLRRLLALPDTCTESACVMLEEQVAALCSEQGPTLVPYLTRLLALPEDAPTKAHLDSLVAAGLLQSALFRAMSDLLASATRQQPLVLVLEDIHWADEASLALLAHLLPLTDQRQLLLVAVLRPERAHACWRIREAAVRDYAHRHTNIELSPLSADESTALVRYLLATSRQSAAAGPARDAEIPRMLHARAEGNPFFTAELVRVFLETGGAPPAVTVVGGLPTATVLPHTVLGVLMARIDKLPTAARQVLQLAAVVGRVFPYAVLGEILTGLEESDASVNVPRGALDEALLRLVRAQMIREWVPDRPADPAPERAAVRTYVFEHQLTLEAAYSSLLQRKRSILHRRVAEALERLYPDQTETQLGLLANHWKQAGDTERAIAYLRRAGDQAAAQYANQEALTYYARALDLLPNTALELRCDLLFSRIRIHQLRGDLQSLGQDLNLLEPLVTALGSPSREAELALAQAHHHQYSGRHEAATSAAQTAVRITAGMGDHRLEALGLLYLQMASPGAARGELTDYGRRAIAAARTAGARDIEGLTLREAGMALVHGGKHEEGRATLEQALEVYRGIGDRAGEGNVLDALATLAMIKGRYGSAEELAKQGIALQKEVGNRFDEGYGYYALATASVFLGKYGQALTAVEHALALFAELQNAQGTAWVLNVQGILYTELGAYGKAAAAFEQVIEAAESDLTIGPTNPSLAGLALVHSLRGEHGAALSYTARLLERVKQARMYQGWESGFEAWATLIMANTATEKGDLDSAHQHYMHADAVFRDATEPVIMRPNMHLDATAGLARLAEAQGDTSLALQHVEVLLEHLSTGPVDGALEPLRVYLTCYRILAAHGDPRASQILKEGHRLLMARAASIDDAALRHSYLEHVAANRELLAAARGAGIADGES
jgi:DNA-binding SARP family transcriptional activator/tetratricopeptide (TPR) repeat protein/class 3 adenylate cyclase